MIDTDYERALEAAPPRERPPFMVVRVDGRRADLLRETRIEDRPSSRPGPR